MVVVEEMHVVKLSGMIVFAGSCAPMAMRWIHVLR